MGGAVLMYTSRAVRSGGEVTIGCKGLLVLEQELTKGDKHTEEFPDRTDCISRWRKGCVQNG